METLHEQMGTVVNYISFISKKMVRAFQNLSRLNKQLGGHISQNAPAFPCLL